MTILTNEYVQGHLKEAIDKLEAMNPLEDRYLALQIELVKHTLDVGRGYSASGNSHPGLGGRGLKELLALADSILGDSFNFFKVELDFKKLAGAFL